MSDLKQLPLHARHAAAGARFAPFAGYEMPVRYGSIKDEHHAVRRRAGMFDVSHMGEIFLRGPDAIAAIDRIVTNDCTKLEDGKALYTMMCLPDGGIIDDLIVYRLSQEEVLVCANASNRAKDFSWIRSNVRGDCSVVDESDAWVQLAVQGPLSEEIVAEVLGAGVRGVDTFRVASFEMGGASVLAARTGYTGEDGFEIYAPVSAAEMLFDALVKAGEPHGMALCGLGARDTLRMEARLALYGNDIDESTNPWEAGLGWVVKLDSEDFIGREALSALREQGPERRFRGLVLKGPGVIRSGYDIYVGEERVGRTTSGGIAPTLDDASIGLAYIARDYADAEEVSIDIRGRRIPAAVTTRPFYRRSR